MAGMKGDERSVLREKVSDKKKTSRVPIENLRVKSKIFILMRAIVLQLRVATTAAAVVTSQTERLQRRCASVSHHCQQQQINTILNNRYLAKRSSSKERRNEMSIIPRTGTKANNFFANARGSCRDDSTLSNTSQMPIAQLGTHPIYRVRFCYGVKKKSSRTSFQS